jgi:glycosyltransferase involved in cell wall biosynthesis
MRIAILHYHLRPGGVTRVIQSAVKALRDEGHTCAVFSGEPPEEGMPFDTEVVVLPQLAYSNGSDLHGQDLADGLEAKAKAALGGPADLWHVHNHSLGKNPDVARAVYCLALAGRRLVLQVHDFAEDGRPANYRDLLDRLGGGDPALLTSLLYPQAPTVHYATLNSRDLGHLRRAGIPAARAHLLPNPVVVEQAGRPHTGPAGGRYFVYPTRAIRRKNIGEFLIWSAMPGEGDRFGVTLAPRNPAFRPVYDRWVSVASELNLPVEFEVGRDRAFEQVVSEATALVSTSVAEGFGLAFLEPWLSGKPLAGRNLPDVTDGFAEAGVDLSGLYDRLLVPVAWLGSRVIRERVASGLKAYIDAYGRDVTGDDIASAYNGMVSGDRVDVGRLDEPLQEKVLRRLATSAEARAEMCPSSLMPGECSERLLERNRAAVASAFGLAGYGKRLTAMYGEVPEEAPVPLESLTPNAVLDEFLDPARFNLLRT